MLHSSFEGAITYLNCAPRPEQPDRPSAKQFDEAEDALYQLQSIEEKINDLQSALEDFFGGDYSADFEEIRKEVKEAREEPEGIIDADAYWEQKDLERDYWMSR